MNPRQKAVRRAEEIEAALSVDTMSAGKRKALEDGLTAIADNMAEGCYSNDPDDGITREQMAVMLYNYKGYTISGGSAAAFTDEDNISSWAYEAVKAIQKMGVVGGKPGNLYDPQGMATRAEVATLFTNFVNYVAGVTATGNKTAASNAMNANTMLAMLPGKEDEIAPTDESDGEGHHNRI